MSSAEIAESVVIDTDGPMSPIRLILIAEDGSRMAAMLSSAKAKDVAACLGRVAQLKDVLTGCRNKIEVRS